MVGLGRGGTLLSFGDVLESGLDGKEALLWWIRQKALIPELHCELQREILFMQVFSRLHSQCW